MIKTTLILLAVLLDGWLLAFIVSLARIDSLGFITLGLPGTILLALAPFLALWEISRRIVEMLERGEQQ